MESNQDLKVAGQAVPPAGPFETREQATQAAAGIHAAMRADTLGGAMTRAGRDLIRGACQAAGVTLGAYDARIVEWLAGIEPEYAAVIAGLVERAAVALTDAQREALRLALADAFAHREGKSYVRCADCDASPVSLCDEHAADFDRIESYATLAREQAIEVNGR